MIIDINFSNIREHDGSKQNGFEELVCQIAHIEKPIGAKRFVRKEGSGGDAGVECFWVLNDGQEYAWQAKYFTERLTSSRWTQINESVETAINKHDKLSRYYVCIPIDRTDSRKERKGKPTKSSLDYWNEYVEKWTALASKKGMNVEFEYWGKHELTLYLQKDKPEYTGRVLYWFNTAVISRESLLRLAENSRECLGERFTPEYHVELPIAKSFSCIGFDENWKNYLRNILSDIYNLRKEIKTLNNYSLLDDKKELCKQIIDKYEQFLNTAFEFENDSIFLFNYLEDFKKSITEFIDMCNELDGYIFEKYSTDSEMKEKFRDTNNSLRKITISLGKLEEFFTSRDVIAGKRKELLITGVAGSGKSHLLCDVSMKRLKDDLPTIFLLGQHYSGGNPIRFIAEKLDLINYSDSEVLGALDALGEANKSRTLIIVDAVNEGNGREEWRDHLKMFLQQCKEFNNLAVVISCRNTYTEFIISDEVLNKITIINHEGFRGYERRAALKYLGNQGISLPSVPFFSPEFSNPLFLKTTCSAIKKMGLREFPKGLKGFSNIFEFYLESLEKIIKQKKYTHSNELVKSAVNAFINKLYPDNLWGISYGEAVKIINDCDFTNNGSTPLFDLLIFEGLISYDVIKNNLGKKVEVVRFTYERFSDYAITNHILGKYNTEEELDESFSEGGAIFRLLKSENRYSHAGIIQALGIEIPEKFGREFIEYIKPEESDRWRSNWYLETTFKNGILSRTANSITEKSLELLNELGGYRYHSEAMDILISLSTEPNHPWNSEFLDSNLRKRKLAERDLFWSTYVAVNDYYEDEDQSESPIRTLLNWILDSELNEVEQERLRLSGIVLLWMTTTSNREIRQQATKALSKVLYHIPGEISAFIELYNNIDDSYLVTSLYGAIYGAIMNIKNNKLVKEISDLVIKKQFYGIIEDPHILIRDYARGIIEYAYYLEGKTDEIEQFRPPYKSKWPLENPLPSEIDALSQEYSSIKNSVQAYIGDFGRYVLNDIENWTATPLSKEIPVNGKNLQYHFAETLPKELRLRYIEMLDRKIEKENNKNFSLESYLEALKLYNSFSDIESGQDWEDEIEELEDDLIDDAEDEELGFIPLMKETSEKQLITEILSVLGETEQEYFKWVLEQGVSERVVRFSHSLSCRWVIKRVYELGWTKELFNDFESIYCNSEYRMGKGVIERIGKKYQWIAYYELLARLADNLIFRDRGYSDVDDSKFYGPWQIDIREMDPSYWIRAKTRHSYDDSNIRWWRPYQFKSDSNKLEEQKKWLWDTNSLPNLQSIICTKNNETQEEWITLRSFCNWKTDAIKDTNILGEPNIWYRINTCIIKQENLEVVKESLIGQELCSPDIIYIPDSNNQRFLGEYPWHPCYDNLEEWVEHEEWDRFKIPCKYHVPLFEYSWSTSNFSHMPDESSTFYMPSKKIVKEMQLYRDDSNPSNWFMNDKLVFMDPSLNIDTQPCALIQKDIFSKWLYDKGYCLIWLIGGEKQLFTHNVEKFYGRLVYSGLYSMDGSGNITGECWAENQLPRKELI